MESDDKGVRTLPRALFVHFKASRGQNPCGAYPYLEYIYFVRLELTFHYITIERCYIHFPFYACL